MSGKDDVLMEWLNDNCGYFFRTGKLIEKFRSNFQEIEVFEIPQLGRLFRLDGSFMTSERDEFFYHENLVHIPAITHPNPTNVLVVGGGDGGSTEELLKHPTVKKVTLAEIDGGVIDISKKYLQSIHHDVFDDPRVDLRVTDGLAFVRDSKELFDLIVLDLTDPGGPSQPLYTKEFYNSCRARLTPNGLMSLHISSPVTQPERYSAIIGNLKSVFSNVRPYLIHIPLYGTLWGMACASMNLDPIKLSSKEVDEIIAKRKISDLQYYNGQTHQAVCALPNFVRALLEQ
jgi:spermidine synthase